MKHLLYLPLIVAAMFLTAQADPAIVGQVQATGSFHGGGGPANSSAHASIGPGQAHQPGQPGGHPNNGQSLGDNGPRCAPSSQQFCTPLIFINPGPYTNYQVISPSTTTITPNSDAASYSSYYVASPQAGYAPVLAPSAPAVAVGTVDDKGLVHSPYSQSVLKIANVRNGQAVHDPATGQVFYVQMSGKRLSNQID